MAVDSRPGKLFRHVQQTILLLVACADMWRKFDTRNMAEKGCYNGLAHLKEVVANSAIPLTNANFWRALGVAAKQALLIGQEKHRRHVVGERGFGYRHRHGCGGGRYNAGICWGRG